MKCADCLPLIEEYVDGELSERETEQVSTHLALCEACAAGVNELEREQEIYARYERETEVAPAMWSALYERIKEEKTETRATVGAFTRLQAWFAQTFGASGLLQRPALTAAVILIALGIVSVVVIRYLSLSRQAQPVATHTEQPPKIQEPGSPNQTIAPVKEREEPKPISSPLAENVAIKGSTREKRKAIAAQPSKHPEKFPQPENIAQDKDTQFFTMTSSVDNVITSAPQVAGDPDRDVARHIEKALLLLRSFRNVRLAETSHAPDISYEKEQARKLLYQNIVLRREAASQGNQPAEKMLSALEPILLDIANLPDHPTNGEVRSIAQRMKKKEIIAALQVHSMVAAD